MTDPRSATRQRVRDIVARDIKPVRPLLPPGRRVLLLVPIAIAAAICAPFGYGHRNFDHLGWLASWGVSALEWILGLLILAVALRHAVPGRGVSRRFLIATLVGAPALIVLVTVVTYAVEPTKVPPGLAFRFWIECVKWPITIAAPILLVASLLAMRAFPTRPGPVGALCGLAAGVLADSGWRLACDVSAPSHVLGSHGLAIVLVAGLGAVASVAIDAIRR
ncbi:MAG: hypothetical protein AUJ01_03075 [Acidobacteria bacterium 13_1_40CM_3_65_5]|nr:MAG: hypothetical protein AUJ01_03075 [Acidobacteria bacterium 13_1_40CM_3_65_5]